MTVNFSSGPTNKWPNFSKNIVDTAILGRSHRAKSSIAKIQEVISLIREIMLIPNNFFIGLTPGSATGAFECAMWNFLSDNIPVNIISYDVFGEIWKNDIIQELGIQNIIEFNANFGEVPKLTNINCNYDTIFISTATTSSTQIKDMSWVENNRTGLVLCDAAADAFSRIYDWNKIDVLTCSFQKVMGCEANNGIIICSPNAIKRLESNTYSWAIPRLFRLKNNNKVNYDFFNGATINTISMLCIEEYILALRNLIQCGGINFVINHCTNNQNLVEAYVKKSRYFELLCKQKKHRSLINTCITLKRNNSWKNIEKITTYMENFNIAYDIHGHTKGEPCIRIWHGYTIDHESLENLLKNLEKVAEKILN